ncbi:hypothetical protein FRB95_009323 [Tulasnella sp. JGI-2019a]|nr:hypothetical protein FRB95_009323 [Tulasnella sp. JGI-2019a]
MAVSVTGGTPPYKFVVVIEWDTTKTITYSTGYFNYVLDVPSKSHVLFAVTDATGKGAVGPQFTVGPSGNSSCLSLAPALPPLSPGLTSVYPGLPTPAVVSVNEINPTPDRKASVAALASGVVGGSVFLLLAAVAGALWQKKRSKIHNRHNYNFDLFDATEPASRPASSNSIITPTPYAYDTSSVITKAELDGLSITLPHKSFITPVRHTRASAFYEHFSAVDTSPPYTQMRSGTMTSSTYNPPPRRYSATSTLLTDTSSDGVGSALSSIKSSDQDLSATPILQGGRPPSLPPGAAAPITPSVLQWL